MRRRVTPVHAFGLVLAASVAVLGTALFSQYVGGLQPCVLCIYQRVPYVLAIALCALALAVAVFGGGTKPSLTRSGLVICVALFIAGAGIAAYHVGVEQGWWMGTEACAGSDLNALTIEDLRQQLLQKPIARCDEVAWSAFGISMAGYNFIVSLLLAGGCVVLGRVVTGRSEPA